MYEKDEVRLCVCLWNRENVGMHANTCVCMRKVWSGCVFVDVYIYHIDVYVYVFVCVFVCV